MRPTIHPLPPSSSLPPLRTLPSLSRKQIFSAVHDISSIFCPLPISLAFSTNAAAANQKPKRTYQISTPVTTCSTPLAVDSGYASGTEDEVIGGGYADDRSAKAEVTAAEAVAAIRNDEFERQFVERWVTGFVARVEELECLDDEDGVVRQDALDQACLVLESLLLSGDTDDGDEGGDGADGDEDGYTRDFTFDLNVPSHLIASSSPTEAAATSTIKVQLNDHLAGTSSSDHEDVGLQSWGASMVFSRMICEDPERFGLSREALLKSSSRSNDEKTQGDEPRIAELGAGTGLVSMVLAGMLPKLDMPNAQVVATDYHPAVLANLSSNIAMNSPEHHDSSPPLPLSANIQVSPLDWSSPDLTLPSLSQPFDMLLATDVIYAAQHAIWLRDCASLLLRKGGTFWLMATVRQNGRFEGISETVGKAFPRRAGPDDHRATRQNGESDNGEEEEEEERLVILSEEVVEKTKGVGRGDESGYRLFKIGWQGDCGS